jgi:hypothetical protein
VPNTDPLKGEKLAAAPLRSLPRGVPKTSLLPLAPVVEPTVDGSVAKHSKDLARKSERTKLSVQSAHTGHLGDLEARPSTGNAEKGPKGDLVGLVKTAEGEARADARRGVQLVRVVDLRRGEKPRESGDANSRKPQGASAIDTRTPLSPVARLVPESESRVQPPLKVSPTHAQPPLERLREMAGSELVRASTLVLRDGGGEIRLVLKPESLGSVRIRMNVVDNAIEGHIIVDSAAVKHVFDGSVDALRRALTAEGFQTGSLQVSVGGQNTDADQRQQSEAQEASAAARRITAQDFERNVPGLEHVSLGDLFVNLFV